MRILFDGTRGLHGLRIMNGGRRWKSESSWMPFGNGEFGVNSIAVWRHVNAIVRSLTFTSDSTDFILTYHSQWMHIPVNCLAYSTSLTKSGTLLQFRLFTVPYFSVRSTRSMAYCYWRPSWFQMYWGGGHSQALEIIAVGKGDGVWLCWGEGGWWEKGRDWLLSQHHCNSNSRPLLMQLKFALTIRV